MGYGAVGVAGCHRRRLSRTLLRLLISIHPIQTFVYHLPSPQTEVFCCLRLSFISSGCMYVGNESSGNVGLYSSVGLARIDACRMDLAAEFRTNLKLDGIGFWELRILRDIHATSSGWLSRCS